MYAKRLSASRSRCSDVEVVDVQPCAPGTWRSRSALPRRSASGRRPPSGRRPSRRAACRCGRGSCRGSAGQLDGDGALGGGHRGVRLRRRRPGAGPAGPPKNDSTMAMSTNPIRSRSSEVPAHRDPRRGGARAAGARGRLRADGRCRGLVVGIAACFRCSAVRCRWVGAGGAPPAVGAGRWPSFVPVAVAVRRVRCAAAGRTPVTWGRAVDRRGPRLRRLAGGQGSPERVVRRSPGVGRAEHLAVPQAGGRPGWPGAPCPSAGALSGDRLRVAELVELHLQRLLAARRAAAASSLAARSPRTTPAASRC